MKFSLEDQRIRIAAIVVAVVFVLPLTVYGTVRLSSMNKILPHTRIGAVDVGGLSRSLAREKVQARFDTLRQNGLPVVVSGNAKTLTVSDANLDMNVEAAVNAAWSRGRDFSLGSILDGITSPWLTRSVSAGVSVNEPSLRSEIEDTAVLLEDPPKDVRLDIQGTRVNVLYDTKSGKTLDRDKLVRESVARLRTLDVQAVQATFIEQHPVIDRNTASTAVTEAQRMMSQPITLTDRGQKFEATPSIIGQWIISGADGSRLVATPDRAEISTYIAGIAAQINQLPQNLGVKVEGERVVDFIAPRPGRVIEEEKVIEEIIAELERRRQNQISTADITLHAIVKEADTEGDAATLGIKELVGRATTPFTGSPANRIANIKNGTRFLTGLIVKPGEEFSTINALGTIDNTTGYLPELVIKGNRTTPEFGGGLCQVSTTLFRSVLNAGLPVTARQNHSYRVSYYEKDGEGKTIGPGLDATIYQPAPDFKFRNDTAHSILISGYVVGDRLTFELYGTKDGRSAIVDGPKLLSSTPSGNPIYVETDTLPPGEQRQIEKPHPGGSAIATYKVTYADGTSKEQVFRSSYRAWPAQFLVGVEPKPAEPTTTDTSVPPTPSI